MRIKSTLRPVLEEFCSDPACTPPNVAVPGSSQIFISIQHPRS